jgi:hypothetical protein
MAENIMTMGAALTRDLRVQEEYEREVVASVRNVFLGTLRSRLGSAIQVLTEPPPLWYDAAAIAGAHPTRRRAPCRYATIPLPYIPELVLEAHAEVLAAHAEELAALLDETVRGFGMKQAVDKVVLAITPGSVNWPRDKSGVLYMSLSF